MSKILVVDDDEAMVDLLQMVLEADGHAVLRAHDGEEALRLTRHEAPDLVLLDVLMPVMDGSAVCAKLKTDPTTARIPVVFVTSLDRRDCIEGADAYIRKPFDLATLESMLIDLL